MTRKAFLISLTVSVFVFSTIAGNCFSDVTAEIVKAKEYTDNEYFQRAERIYTSIIRDNPGSDYALEAQKNLIFPYLAMQQKVGTKTAPQTTFDKLESDYSANPRLVEAIYDVTVKYERYREYDKAKNLYQKIIRRHEDSLYASKAKLNIPKIEILRLIKSRQDNRQTGSMPFVLSSIRVDSA